MNRIRCELRSEYVGVFVREEKMRRRSKCVGLLGEEEVLVCLAEWDQHLVRVRRKGIQMIPGLEGPAPFQCQ